jgi:tetratricopeptide (TPR) repeat protein
VKKETIITAVTAIVFLGVGFLAGYIYEAQRKPNAQPSLAAAGNPQPQNETPGSAGTSAPSSGATTAGLPEGHPPIDMTGQTKVLEDEAAQNPKDPAPRLELANSLYDQKQYDKAIEWYRQALELDPKNINARTDLGTAYFYTGRPQDALKQYRKSLELDPRHEPTLYNVILVNLYGTHDLARAQEAWHELHKLNPNHPGLDNLKQRLEAARPADARARAPQ